MNVKLDSIYVERERERESEYDTHGFLVHVPHQATVERFCTIISETKPDGGRKARNRREQLGTADCVHA